MSIYTKTGDKGTTGIHGGERVAKDDIRIETNGSIDELNSVIGLVRSQLDKEHDWQPFLYKVQKEIMVIMSLVATPSSIIHRNPNKFDASIIDECENLIDAMSKEMGASRNFLLPGGNFLSSHLHIARTFARRSERRLWTLHKKDPQPQNILVFFNRLSDLFFVMARYELFVNNKDEEVWKEFAYKRSAKHRDRT